MSTQVAVGGSGDRPEPLDAIVVGAGFAGMHMVYRLREMGLSFIGLEEAGDVGGTWYWNRYPGARCDVMSIDYSCRFSPEIDQEWTWSERYSSGKEILAYANFIADKLDLRKHFRFDTRVDGEVWDDARRLWKVTTEGGEVFEARYCIMATGFLTVPKPIDIPGASEFQGESYRTSRWPHHEVELAGKRVGIIGTGSTGIQMVPVVAEVASELHVFQRTPSFSVPMRNNKLSPEYMAQVKAHYPELRALSRTTFVGGVRPTSTRAAFSVTAEEQQYLMEEAWERNGVELTAIFSDILNYQPANDLVADFVRRKIGEVLKDPETAEKLKPRGYPIFARRPCLDTNYYETFNRPNVRLVDCLSEPIEAITSRGVRTSRREIELDVIVYAIGFDALAGGLLAVDAVGRGGRKLSAKWRDGPRSNLGIMMEGFPNLFATTGANSPSALANGIMLGEVNGDWIVSCIDYMRRHGLETVETSKEAEEGWMAQVQHYAERSLQPKAATWYTGANIPGKPRVYPIYAGGLNRYIEICDRLVAEGFPGFVFETGATSRKSRPVQTMA